MRSGKRIPNCTRSDSIRTLSKVMLKLVLKKVIAFLIVVVLCLAINFFKKDDTKDSPEKMIGLEKLIDNELIF